MDNIVWKMELIDENTFAVNESVVIKIIASDPLPDGTFNTDYEIVYDQESLTKQEVTEFCDYVLSNLIELLNQFANKEG